MKKILAVTLSIVMVLMCCLPVFAAEKTITSPASAFAEYDKAKVAQNDADYIASLDYDQIAGGLLDWLDRKIAAAAEDFNAFTESVGVDLSITGVDSLIGMKDHAAELEGDFENLDTSALVTREGGDVNFFYGVFQFMADNAETFGKVFRWDGEVFNYGKVGEFIESDACTDQAVKDFYHDYLVTGDIQDKFIREIASEMGYEVPETRTETFDEILNNGIKQALAPVLKDILTTQASKAAYDAFDLRTTDVYTLVKAYVGLLQNDYKDQFDNMLSGFLSALQGMITVITEGVNIEPPVLTIGDANGVIGTYHPADTDFESYMPAIYSPYREHLSGTAYYDMIKGETAPEGLISGEGVDMAEKFVMNVAPVPDELAEAGYSFPIEISFDEIKTYANGAIAAALAVDEDENGVGDIQDQVNAVVAQAVDTANQIPFIGGSITGTVTIDSITVSLSYKGYAADDSFVVEVTAIPSYDITYGGNIWTYASMVGITQEKIQSDYIEPAVAEYIQNPAATVVVTNLSGTIAELEQLQTLVSYIDPNASYDYTLLNVSGNDYDTYKGVVGQANHILYKLVDMIASDAGMSDLALADGDNTHLYSNLQKICAKVSGLLDTMKEYIDQETFVAVAEAAGISDVFASEHGFNAEMVYRMDFSSVENALDCGIRIACDLLAEDDPDSIFYQFHMRVEELETLDGIAAAAVDMILDKLLAKVELEGWTRNASAIDAQAVDAGTVTAKNAVLGEITDILYDAATLAVSKINTFANDLIADWNADTGLNIGTFTLNLGVEKNADWAVTLEALADRFIALTDGVCIPAGTAKDQTGLWNKLTTLASIIPMTSMFSNYNGLEAMNEAFFDEALDGDLDNFLSYFEVKEDAVAGEVPVTFALINASDYIVDRFFPDTVQAELYADYDPMTEVQEYFTGNESDQGIAARNMVSINARRANILPCLLDLIRETGLLPGFACDHTNTENVAEVPSTCTVAGTAAGVRCADCGAVLSGCEALELAAHSYTVLVEEKAATCTEGGYKIYKCAACDLTETRDRVNALGHNYEDGVCTRCNAADPNYNPGGGDNGGSSGNFFSNIFANIRSFFQRIIDFFKGLFNR
ncbi:MAG: hypothetical protein IJS90_06755 [Clostridia bacterium]|nr:hypothetical protein [Clostridia bacterium]